VEEKRREFTKVIFGKKKKWKKEKGRLPREKRKKPYFAEDEA